MAELTDFSYEAIISLGPDEMKEHNIICLNIISGEIISRLNSDENDEFVCFGVSRDDAEHFMAAKAQGKEHEMMASMLAHKAARIEATQNPPRKP